MQRTIKKLLTALLAVLFVIQLVPAQGVDLDPYGFDEPTTVVGVNEDESEPDTTVPSTTTVLTTTTAATLTESPDEPTETGTFPNEESTTAVVDGDGTVHVFGYGVHGESGGARPALWLNLS
jgi:hypothetical protein